MHKHCIEYIFTTSIVFIRKYAQYLEEKVLVFRALRMEFEKDPTLLKGLSVEESFVRLPKIQRQLDALIHCQVGFYFYLFAFSVLTLGGILLTSLFNSLFTSLPFCFILASYQYISHSF